MARCPRATFPMRRTGDDEPGRTAAWEPWPRPKRPARTARKSQPPISGGPGCATELAETVGLQREELGWSQRQLAERAGMSQPGVAQFEAGGTTPTLPLLERLAEALGLTLTVTLGSAQRRSA